MRIYKFSLRRNVQSHSPLVHFIGQLIALALMKITETDLRRASWCSINGPGPPQKDCEKTGDKPWAGGWWDQLAIEVHKKVSTIHCNYLFSNQINTSPFSLYSF